MEAIAKCTGLLSRLQTCIEFNLGFISYEKRVFHFDAPDIIPKLFPPTRPEILHEIADKVIQLLNLFVTHLSRVSLLFLPPPILINSLFIVSASLRLCVFGGQAERQISQQQLSSERTAGINIASKINETGCTGI